MSLSTIYLGAVALVAIAILCTLVSRRTMFAYLQSWLEKPTPDYFALCDIAPPTPLPDFNIDKAKPRPYRPFRWDYHQTMALKKLEPDWWIELESTYRERIAQRKALYEKNGSAVLDMLPGSEPGCRELMQMAIQYICVRYPALFSLDERNGRFVNNILGTETDVRNAHPLEVLIENIPEDFLLTFPDPKTGLYCLRAGVVCSSLGWNLGTKIGKPLHAIHDVVPDYKEKMQMSMDRYFNKMLVDKPIQRGSWGIEIGQPLFMMPDDPHFTLRSTQKPDLRPEDLYLRVDWQTLRRLPKSRAILFNYKAVFTPFTEFRNEPYVPKLVLKVLREGKKGIMEYKGTWHVEHVAIPALDSWAKEQEETGLVTKDWKERTLNEDPFFPGWEEKWRTQCM